MAYLTGSVWYQQRNAGVSRCGVLPEPPAKPQVRRGGKVPTEGTLHHLDSPAMEVLIGVIVAILFIGFVHTGKRRKATAEEKQAIADAKKAAVRRAMGEDIE